MRRWIFVAAALAVPAVAALALAQRADPRRPLTLTVGTAAGMAPTVRGDARRTGLVHAPLPRGALHVDWRFGLGGIEQPPVVTQDTIIVVTTTGNVVAIPNASRDHDEKWHQSLGVSSSKPTAPVLLADGTIVVAAGAVDGVAVGVQKNGVRFRTPLVGKVDESLTPLALDDGGVAVASESELAVLDSQGNVRSRVSLPEIIGGPLIANGTRILVVTKATGVVLAWTPGRDVARVGSFGARVMGGAILIDDNTLLAVVEGPRMVTVDLRQGLAVPLSTFPGGSYFWPPAYRRGIVYTMAGIPNRTFVVGVDSAGQEVLRVPIASSLAIVQDAGAGPFIPPAHTPVIIDETGAIGFASPEGPIGVIDPGGVVTNIGEPVCNRGSVSRGLVATVASGGPGVMLVTCSTGNLVRIVHGDVSDP